MKRTLSFLLACLLVLGLFPVHVHAQETEAVVMETTISVAEEEFAEETVPVLYDSSSNDTRSSADWIDGTTTGSLNSVGTISNPSIDVIDYYKFQISGTKTVTITVHASKTLKIGLEDSNGSTLGTSSSKIQKTLSAGTYYVWVNDSKNSHNSYQLTVSYDGNSGGGSSHTHSYTAVVTKATCENGGYTTYTCACGYSYKGDYTPPTGHVYYDGGDTCQKCGMVHTHLCSSEVTDPTCTEQGYTTHTCILCDYSYKDTYKPATGHSYSDDLDESCDTCGYIREIEYGTSMEIPVEVTFGTTYKKSWNNTNLYKPHYSKFTLTERGIVKIHATKPVDYQGTYSEMNFTIFDSDGNEIYTNLCLNQMQNSKPDYNVYCGLEEGTYYLGINLGLFATGAISSDYTITFEPNLYCEVEPNEDTTHATPLSFGKTYTAHIGQDGITDKSKNDYYQFHVEESGSYKITVKDFEKLVKTNIIFELSGVFQDELMRFQMEYDGSNSYTFQATDTGTCFIRFYNASEQYAYRFMVEDLSSPAHSHSYTSVVTDPTCGSQGYTTYTCTCGDSYKDNYVPATGEHTYSGKTDESCNVCGYVREIGGSDSGTDTGELGTEENPVIVTLGETYRKEWENAEVNPNLYTQFTILEQGIVTFYITKPVAYNKYRSYGFTLSDLSGNTIYVNDCYQAVDDDKTYYEFHCGLEAGTYIWKIDYGYNSSPSDYKITFSPTQYCEVEPNDGKETATVLTLGKPYTGHYGGGSYDFDKADWYQFELKKDCTYQISVDGLQAVDPTICLMGDSMADQYISNEENYVFKAPADDTYNLKINNRHSRQYTYQISIQTLDSFAQEAAFDTDYRKEWNNYSNDEHYVKFTVPEQGIATFHVTKPVVEDEFHSYTFTIWDASENTIFSMGTKDSVTDKNTYYEFHCGLEAGNYYLMIVPNYTLLFQTFSSDYRIRFTPDAHCEIEPNGDKETATKLTLGVPHTGHYGSDGSYSHANSDYYKFDAIAGHTYKITIENFEQFQDAYAYFYLHGETKTSLKYTMKNQVDENGLHYYTFTADEDETLYIEFEGYRGVQLPYKIMVAEDHTHSYTSVVTEPTCTEEGYTTHTCECGDSYVDSKVSKLGHDYVNYVCTRCGDVKYSITRISGKDRHDTAFKIANKMKEVLKLEKFDTILIASGSDSADALAGSYLAAMKQAPILLSRNNSHPRNLAYIQENLSANGIVYILGGTGAVPQEMEDLLIANNIRYERVKGKDRFGTNIEILKKAGDIQGNEILVSTGYNFADSLSASATGKPILLVNSKRNILTDAQKAYLSEITAGGGKTFTIIGGTGAVSNDLADALEAYGKVSREKGATRELTSVKVATAYFQEPEAVFLAYSRNFPDGLCGGPLAYAMKAPLLLVNKNQETAAAVYVAASSITTGYILGGTAAVSQDSVNRIFPK